MTMNEIEAYLEDIATELLFSDVKHLVKLGNDMMEKLSEHRAGYDEPDVDDDADGDHASALASAGFGTDEDYNSHTHGWENDDYDY
jgi:hypothetical protein